MNSPLFSTESVVRERRPPVVVVGMPRSGSSFLSHVLSALDDWYVWDDLYFLQRVKTLPSPDALSCEHVHGLINYLGWTIRTKLNHDDDFTKPEMSLADVDRMVEAMKAAFPDGGVAWHVLLEEWMTRLALHHGRTRWGYKTPQDFHHMDELADAYPGIRFVYIVRDPRRMMASFKFVNDKDGRPGQYHPVVYSQYWKIAYRKVKAFESKDRAPVLTMRFEELTVDPNAAARALGAFLDAQLNGSVPEQGRNTSFGSGQRRDITPTEQWICQRIAGAAMDALRYDREPARPRLRDLGDLAGTTLRFAGFHTRRLITERHSRGSVGEFIKSLGTTR